MDKRIHFIQVQPSKFGNQLKKILNKGQYCKLLDGILVYYIEGRFLFRLLVHLDTFISSWKT